MKKLTLITAIIFSIHLFAGNVTLQQAKKVALNFYFEKYNQYEGPLLYDQLAIQTAYTKTDGRQNFYYVFQINRVDLLWFRLMTA